MESASRVMVIFWMSRIAEMDEERFLAHEYRAFAFFLLCRADSELNVASDECRHQRGGGAERSGVGSVWCLWCSSVCCCGSERCCDLSRSVISMSRGMGSPI